MTKDAQINKTSLTKMVDGLFTSKINYGLQLYGKVRTENTDPTNGDIKAIQKVQNKLIIPIHFMLLFYNGMFRH